MGGLGILQFDLLTGLRPTARIAQRLVIRGAQRHETVDLPGQGANSIIRLAPSPPDYGTIRGHFTPSATKLAPEQRLSAEQPSMLEVQGRAEGGLDAMS